MCPKFRCNRPQSPLSFEVINEIINEIMTSKEMLSTYPLLPYLQVPYLKGQGAGAHKMVSTKNFWPVTSFLTAVLNPSVNWTYMLNNLAT